MARRAHFREGEVAAAEKLAANAKTIQQLRQAQAMLLPALGGLTIATTARVLGIGRNQVCVLRRAFREAGGTTFADYDRRGGRHRELMTLGEEEAFVASWMARTDGDGAPVVVSDIHAAYEAAVGKSVPRSTLYRLLHRHGWHAPAKRHGNGEAVPAAATDSSFAADAQDSQPWVATGRGG